MRRYYSDSNNLITYGYCLVYLPFDLNSSCSTYLEMAGLDSLSFERDVEVGLNDAVDRSTKASEQHGHGGHPVFLKYVDHFICQNVVGISVRTLIW